MPARTTYVGQVAATLRLRDLQDDRDINKKQKQESIKLRRVD